MCLIDDLWKSSLNASQKQELYEYYIKILEISAVASEYIEQLSTSIPKTTCECISAKKDIDYIIASVNNIALSFPSVLAKSKIPLMHTYIVSHIKQLQQLQNIMATMQYTLQKLQKSCVFNPKSSLQNKRNVLLYFFTFV